MTTGFRDMKTNDMNVAGCRGCCVYPNGKIGIAAICVGVLGFILAMPAAFGCRYFRDETLGYSTAYFGLFSYESAGTCYYWGDESEFHGTWSFARAMAIIATLCGAIALIFTLCLACMSMPNPLLVTTSALYLVAALCLIFTLVGLAGCDYYGFTCQLGGGGILAIITPMIYFGAALLVFKVPLYESDATVADDSVHPSEKSDAGTYAPGNEVTIEETELPDGSKKTVKTIIDAKGNKTIEETIEPPESDTEDEDVVVSYLADGSIKTTRTTYEKDGTKTVRETIEKPQV